MRRRNFVRTLRSYYSSLAGNLPISQVVSSRVIFRSTHNRQEIRSGPSTCHIFSAGLNISPTVPFFHFLPFYFPTFFKILFLSSWVPTNFDFLDGNCGPKPTLPSPPLSPNKEGTN